jgi:hypothetical protein
MYKISKIISKIRIKTVLITLTCVILIASPVILAATTPVVNRVFQDQKD